MILHFVHLIKCEKTHLNIPEPQRRLVGKCSASLLVPTWALGIVRLINFAQRNLYGMLPTSMVISPTHLLYPPACLLCHQRVSGTTVVCETCRQALRTLLPPVCQRCGVGVAGAYDSQVVCARCQAFRFVFERACAPFSYAGMVREAIHAFKYGGHDRLGLWFADAMIRTAQARLPLTTIERVVPVPMHWLKRRVKGHNPVAFLAKTVAAGLALPYDDRALRRTRWTTTQTRLTGAQRFRNVAGAFTAQRERPQGGGTVLLVDDVLTSGATAQACALALQESGIKTFVVTAARAPILESRATE